MITLNLWSNRVPCKCGNFDVDKACKTSDSRAAGKRFEALLQAAPVAATNMRMCPVACAIPCSTGI